MRYIRYIFLDIQDNDSLEISEILYAYEPSCKIGEKLEQSSQK